MGLQRFNFKAGIYKEGTAYNNEGRFFDGNFIRFRAGFPEKMGGWTKKYQSSFIGVCRKIKQWVALNGFKYIGLGTTKKTYIIQGSSFVDVTPIRATTSAGDVTFAATNGSSTITVTDVAHNAFKNDFVTFSGAASLGGLITAAVLNQEYEIDTVPSTSTFTITAKDTSGNTVTANASDTGNGGSSVVGAYQISVGQDIAVPGGGWGSGDWGDGTWGTGAGTTVTNTLRLWSLDNFGEDLLAVRRGGNLLHWDADASTRPIRAAIVTTAPASINSIVVSPNDRHVLAFGTNEFAGGAFNPLLIRWSDQEDFTNWTPSVSSTSGELQVVDGTTLKGGIRSRNTIHVWSDQALYSLQYVGPPFIFAISQLGTNCGLIGQHAAINVDGISYWMGDNNFYRFDGRVDKLNCTVRRYLYDDFNMAQGDKVYAAVNSEFHEVVWYYPKEGSLEPNAYVLYNYEEDTWAYGTGFYTTFKDATVFTNTIATGKVSAGATPHIWDNEPVSIFTGDGVALSSFLQSADFDIDDGNDLIFADRIIPDYTINQGSINMSVNFREFPAANTIEKGPFEINSGTKKIDFRGRGRQSNVRVSCNDFNTSWKWGSVRMAIQRDGKR